MSTTSTAESAALASKDRYQTLPKEASRSRSDMTPFHRLNSSPVHVPVKLGLSIDPDVSGKSSRGAEVDPAGVSKQAPALEASIFGGRMRKMP